ncbi:MAG: holo-ACP synthase, partial [Calditrichaeota bacterium]|nr:holo-ACP synthase [Calditrichota bacterium]HQU72372.1 holo-ACP synthase [Calditrichia bacterium]
IGTGLVKGFSWHDIEVVNNEAGKPEVVLRNKAAEMLAGKKVHLSLSHSGESAIAMVVVDH